MEVGGHLSIYKNTTILSYKTIEELEAVLRSIRVPYKILQAYHDGKKHIVIINPERRLNKEKLNGSIE